MQASSSLTPVTETTIPLCLPVGVVGIQLQTESQDEGDGRDVRARDLAPGREPVAAGCHSTSPVSMEGTVCCIYIVCVCVCVCVPLVINVSECNEEGCCLSCCLIRVPTLNI